jgi:hypothetical protein
MKYKSNRLATLRMGGYMIAVCMLAQPGMSNTNTLDALLRKEIVRELGDPAELGAGSGKIKHVRRWVDLNGDGRPELLVWVPTASYGGTSGYPLLIFRQERQRLMLLSRIEPVWTPLVISDSSRRGWRDIIMLAGGGGEEMRYVVFQHNGKYYSDNFREIRGERIRGRWLIGKVWDMSVFGPLPL